MESWKRDYSHANVHCNEQPHLFLGDFPCAAHALAVCIESSVVCNETDGVIDEDLLEILELSSEVMIEQLWSRRMSE